MEGGDFEGEAEPAEAAGRRRRPNVGQGDGWPNALGAHALGLGPGWIAKRTANKRAVSGPSWNVASRDAEALARQVRTAPLHGKRNLSRDTARAMSKENVEIVRRAFQAFADQDLDGALADFTEDVEWRLIGGFADLMGSDSRAPRKFAASCLSWERPWAGAPPRKASARRASGSW
jgi:hypothetical protein